MDPYRALKTSTIEVPPFQFTDNNGTNHASMYTSFPDQIEVDMDFAIPVFAWGGDFTEINFAGLNLELALQCIGGATITIPVPGDLTNPSKGFFGFVIDSDLVESMTFKSRIDAPFLPIGGEGFGLDDVCATNQIPLQPVPTLPQWGLVCLMLVLLAAGTRALSQRRLLET